MSTPRRVAGMVLAGGRSRRFGRDKALAIFRGAPLIHWSVEAIRPHVAILAVSGPATLAAGLNLPSVADVDSASAGPIAGILAGLSWAKRNRCGYLLTAPCDTPFLPNDMGARLADAIGNRPVAVARAARVHALCALWRLGAFDALAPSSRQAEQPSLQSLIDRLGGAYVDFVDEAAFANLNTPDEFRDADARASLSQSVPRATGG